MRSGRKSFSGLEGADPARRAGEVRLQEALELEERLVVEADRVHLVGPDAADLQAGGNRVAGELRVVLDAGETLLLGGRDDLAVPHEAGGGVVVPRTDSEDVHPGSLDLGESRKSAQMERLGI